MMKSLKKYQRKKNCTKTKWELNHKGKKKSKNDKIVKKKTLILIIF